MGGSVISPCFSKNYRQCNVVFKKQLSNEDRKYSNGNIKQFVTGDWFNSWIYQVTVDHLKRNLFEKPKKYVLFSRFQSKSWLWISLSPSWKNQNSRKVIEQISQKQNLPCYGQSIKVSVEWYFSKLVVSTGWLQIAKTSQVLKAWDV